MARIEWVRQRLENWALWHERERSGGLGYATQSVLLANPVDGGDREAWVPVDEIEAAVTDLAVESLKLGHGHLHKTLELFYLRGVGIKETATRMQRAESTIKAQLERADHLLAQWFAEHKRRKDEAAQAFRNKLDAARPEKLRGSFTS
jgi:hypothetical protein